jgi:hypothetical protein
MASTKNSPEKPQFARFLEAAEKAGVDKSGRKFAAAMKKVAKAKPKKSK